MEHIDGADPLQYIAELPADRHAEINSYVSVLDMSRTIANTDCLIQHADFFKTFIEIHRRDVFHGDIRASNMKLRMPLDPANPKFVVFDFNLSGSISDFRNRHLVWQG